MPGRKPPEEKTPAKRERNPLWDMLVKLFGEARTPQQRSLYGKICRDLKEAEASPEGMAATATIIVQDWGRKALTPTSLLKYYGRHEGMVADLPSDPDEIAHHERMRRGLEVARQQEAELRSIEAPKGETA